MGRTGTGYEARSTSIRVNFTLDGEHIRERLTTHDGVTLKPTPANLKLAATVVRNLRKTIDSGTIHDPEVYAEFFPHSPRLQELGAAGAGTFGALASLWLESKGTLAPATADQYATAVRFWKRLLGEATPVARLTHKLLVAKIGGYPWPSAVTHNNYLIALRGILGLEYRGRKALENPLAGIENMPRVKTLPDPLTAEERDLVLADMRKHYPPQVVAYFLWQFYTGMRPEETIALRWSDVDMRRQTIRVQRVRTFKGSERDGSKTHQARDVDLMPQALEALQMMKPHTFLQRVEREDDEDTAQDIFQHPVTLRPWHDERSQRDTYWRPSMKRTGLRWRTAYNTRHTFATVALMAGVPPAYVANQLGHSVKMLLDRYARWVPGGDGGSARAMLAAALVAQPQLQTGT